MFLAPLNWTREAERDGSRKSGAEVFHLLAPAKFLSFEFCASDEKNVGFQNFRSCSLTVLRKRMHAWHQPDSGATPTNLGGTWSPFFFVV